MYNTPDVNNKFSALAVNFGSRNWILESRNCWLSMQILIGCFLYRELNPRTYSTIVLRPESDYAWRLRLEIKDWNFINEEQRSFGFLCSDWSNFSLSIFNLILQCAVWFRPHTTSDIHCYDECRYMMDVT